MAETTKPSNSQNVKSNTINEARTVRCRIVEVINNKFIIVFKGLRFAFENKNNKYKKDDIVAVEYTKDKMSIKEK